GDGWQLDNPPVGEELGQIGTNRLGLRRVGRAEVDEQHADARLGNPGMVGGPLHQAAIRSNGCIRKRRPVAEAKALATAAAQTACPSPLTPPGASPLAISSTSNVGMGDSRRRPNAPRERAT